MRSARYREIAEDLRRQLVAGDFRTAGDAGRLLPSEAELGEAYAASRVTVRKALELLRDEGLLTSRQGL
ncbi:MAG: GntR family transcriptional regulator, partial [Acidimicrobiaceae bacterium]